MEPADDDVLPDEPKDTIPLEMFADGSENSWWIELVKSMGGSTKDMSYSKKTNEVSFKFRIKCDGQLVGKPLWMSGSTMMNLLLKCGAMAFDTNMSDIDGREWEIDIPIAPQSMFSMFLESLEEQNSELNNALRGMMAYQSGMLKGVVMSNSIEYDDFVDALFSLITATDNENDDEDEEDV